MTVRWFVAPHELLAISGALNTLMVAGRAEPGCLSCHLSTDVGSRVELEYFEEWQGEEDLKRQVRSNRFARIVELMERATERPQIEFALPGGNRGIDYAAEVRGGGSA